MMQLLVIVLNKLECLDKLLTALEEEHIPARPFWTAAAWRSSSRRTTSFGSSAPCGC